MIIMCSLFSLVVDGSVLLTVTRVGVLDTVDVQWSVGSLVGGTLTPSTGVVTLLPTQAAAVISLSVSIYYMISLASYIVCGALYVHIHKINYTLSSRLLLYNVFSRPHLLFLTVWLRYSRSLSLLSHVRPVSLRKWTRMLTQH